MRREFSILGVSAAALLLAAALPARAMNTDLFHDGDSTTINGGVFSTYNLQPAGSGVVDAFLRTQYLGASSSDQGVERGYNTDGLIEFETKEDTGTGKNFTHSIMLSAVPTVDQGGTTYREFLLDINEPNGKKSKISLDELRFFIADSPTLTGYDEGSNKLAGNSAVWDMDTGPAGDSGVNLDYDLFSGSGESDLKVLIPTDVFGTDESKYVYLFNRFGDQYLAGDGYEEWWVRITSGTVPPTTKIPAPGSLALLAGGLLGLAGLRRRARPRA